MLRVGRPDHRPSPSPRPRSATSHWRRARTGPVRTGRASPTSAGNRRASGFSRVHHVAMDRSTSERPITIREADTIWREEGGWFDARWHFSFDRYRDPEQMGVGALRVFNDDRIIARAEWPMHPHQDIESNTYVVSGSFLHADSLGNNGRLGA